MMRTRFVRAGLFRLYPIFPEIFAAGALTFIYFSLGSLPYHSRYAFGVDAFYFYATGFPYLLAVVYARAAMKSIVVFPMAATAGVLLYMFTPYHTIAWIALALSFAGIILYASSRWRH